MRLRPVAPATDLEAVLEVVQACDRVVYGASDWTADELHEQWAEIPVETDSWVAEAGGRVVGVMHLCERRGDTFLGDGYVHPRARGRGVGTALVRAIAARAEERLVSEPAAGRATLHLTHLVGDTAAPDLFALEGLRPVRSFIRMVIDLGDDLPEPCWPDGVEVRTLDRTVDGHAVYEADRETFTDEWGYRVQPYDAWFERVFATPRLDPTLPTVAWADDVIAGYALVYPKRFGDWGWVGVLGVVPAWRRRGLGSALLQESFRRIRATGETVAALGVDSENPNGAKRLYERAGMRVLWQADVWEKTLADDG